MVKNSANKTDKEHHLAVNCMDTNQEFENYNLIQAKEYRQISPTLVYWTSIERHRPLQVTKNPVNWISLQFR